MSAPTFTRFQCWKDERISEVINLDAIAVDSVNFMATHTPLNRIEYTGRSPEGLNNTGEENLLHELLRLAQDQRHAFMIVEGMPGSGKSHLIRWLKERFSATSRESGSRDVVLLIERANSSLRGALRQIVESEELRSTGIYDEQTLAEQIDRLQHAADLLSGEALNESLLNALQVAAIEVRIPDESDATRLLQNNAAGNMLLDQTFRTHLKRPGGPIDRLVRHLADGRDTQQASDSLPGFEPDDFLLEPDQLRTLDMSPYQEVRVLARRLAVHDRPQLRVAYAAFLNRRLNHAVGRTTSLTSDNIKQVFNDIRRALRRRNYQLVLFIEDITSFTGIDAGLIDVLATQHTGQENVNFARLISVVGITNDYFASRFPDNMKQRVTHHLRLSSDDNSTMLLERPGAVADLSSRYLNAMRVDEPVLQQWMSAGADPKHLPIACTECPFRKECHDSFGYVPIDGSSDDEASRIGLYPFNETALKTMFNNLDRETRTPRSLLIHVLESVLERHGPKVKRGEFPPSRLKLGTKFTAPTMQSIGAHDRLVRQQGLQDSDRLESLFVFWGDRTVNASKQNNTRFIGGIPEGVFTAFSLPVIPGAQTSATITNTTPASTPNRSPLHPSMPSQPASSAPASGEAVSPPRETVDPVLQDITNWRSGRQLFRYEELRRALVNALNTAIDWESHGISPVQLSGRLEPRRVRIEGQSGKTQGEVLEFPRSDDLYDALQAVHALRTPESLLPADLASNLYALRSWIDSVESTVVEFVRKPSLNLPSTPELIQILSIDAFVLASLDGHLAVDEQSTEAIVATLLNQAAVATASTPDSFSTTWTTHFNEASPFRSGAWTRLRKMIGATRSREIWVLLAQASNRSQGGASGVRFMDADLLWREVDRVKKRALEFEEFVELSSLETAPESWSTPLRVLGNIQTSLSLAISEEKRLIDEYHARLTSYLDGEPPETVLNEIRALLQTMRKNGLPQPYERVPVSTNMIVDHLARLKNLSQESQGAKSMIRLSNADRTIRHVMSTLEFFTKVEKLIAKWEQTLPQRLAEQQQYVNDAHTGTTTRAAFDRVSKIISLELKRFERVEVGK